MEQKKNPTVEKKFDAETEWLIDEYKEQQEKDRIEADMRAEYLAEESAKDDGLDVFMQEESCTIHDPSDAMSAEDFVKMGNPKAKS